MKGVNIRETADDIEAKRFQKMSKKLATERMKRKPKFRRKSPESKDQEQPLLHHNRSYEEVV